MTNERNEDVRRSAIEGVLDTLLCKPVWDEKTRDARKTVDYRLGQAVTAAVVSPLYVVPILYDLFNSRGRRK
ncbi:MAG: hypothetical protein WCK90_01665 [archaeon]